MRIFGGLSELEAAPYWKVKRHELVWLGWNRARKVQNERDEAKMGGQQPS